MSTGSWLAVIASFCVVAIAVLKTFGADIDIWGKILDVYERHLRIKKLKRELKEADSRIIKPPPLS